MAKNPIQFQTGLPTPEFFKLYCTEPLSARALEISRWPEAFVCGRSICATHCVLQNGSGGHKVFQCNACRHQMSLIAGTVFQSTKLPLAARFVAIYLPHQPDEARTVGTCTQMPPGCALPIGMVRASQADAGNDERETRYSSSDQVKVDDTYLGGERIGGKVGRGTENKMPFVAALSPNEVGHRLLVKLTQVPRCTLNAITQWAHKNLALGSKVLSGGLACSGTATLAGCGYKCIVIAGSKTIDVPELQWINIVQGNLKTGLSGNYHGFGLLKFAALYLNTFVYRFKLRSTCGRCPNAYWLLRCSAVRTRINRFGCWLTLFARKKNLSFETTCFKRYFIYFNL